MKTKMKIATSAERNHMLGRIGFGIESGIKARDELIRSHTVGGQFCLYLGNAEDAFTDVKQRFDNLSTE